MAKVKTKKKWFVTAEVTISVWTEVEADSEAEAVAAAQDRPLMRFCHQCSGSEGGNEEWRTSGELDGDPNNLRAERP